MTDDEWAIVLQALAYSGGEKDMLQMIDSTIIRAHPAKRNRKV